MDDDILTDAECRKAAKDLFVERNQLARRCADLEDDLTTLKTEFAQAQERYVDRLAELQLATGKTASETAEDVYEDQDRVLQILKEHIFHDGYIEGLREARNATETLFYDASREGWPVKFDQTPVVR